MVAGRVDDGAGQAVHKGPRGEEFAPTAGLGDVAGDGHQVGRLLGELGEHGLERLGVLATEVDVRQMHDAEGHAVSRRPAGGARARKARGRKRISACLCSRVGSPSRTARR